jgi:DNA-binding HxlR family transcriptional regulator
MAAATPRPGSPVRGSATGRPLMAALDLLGRRWALRILWELRDGPLGARALQARCDQMSSSVLYERLRELTDAGLLGRDDNEDYTLTELGAGLGAALEPLDAWARSWSADSHRTPARPLAGTMTAAGTGQAVRARPGSSQPQTHTPASPDPAPLPRAGGG